MFQPAQALQPHFDPPLPPFRPSDIKSWFQEFEAALELNRIWFQEFMLEVLEYVLPLDIKRRLIYFSWSTRLYDGLRDTVLRFRGTEHRLRQGTDRTQGASLPTTIQPSSQFKVRKSDSMASATPLAPWSVQTIALPTTTGYTTDGAHPVTSSGPPTKRPITLVSPLPVSKELVLPPGPLPPLSLADLTPVTTLDTFGFLPQSCPAAQAPESPMTDEPADPPVDFSGTTAEHPT
ncbi:hypothetical protein HPB51_024370 [Rhipicephalus microplus]|uniref:Uncharacterized protein n=1 Tax=Rhipicephalus microplus TaxID=6941 RepID=A0A9J6D7G1_RHIMP|nr:hypothetical protein HPB51_024370 [Rhipicephalus microplus]